MVREIRKNGRLSAQGSINTTAKKKKKKLSEHAEKENSPATGTWLIMVMNVSELASLARLIA